MYKQLSLIAGFIALFSIVVLPVQAAARTGLTVTTINSPRAHTEDIAYSTTNDGFEVRGTVKSRFHNGRIRGHVDVALVDASGKSLKSVSSKLRRVNYSNKHQHRVTFKVLFDELPIGAATLQVKHHVGSDGH